MQLPSTFGRYTLVEKIGEGGLSEVFKARFIGEQGFHKSVAIKMMLEGIASKTSERLLIDEAHLLVRLQHPNIVQVHDLGRVNKRHYLVMEYIHGVDLEKLRSHFEKKENLSQRFACFIVLEVLKGLHYIHECRDDGGALWQLVHRDISPHNILISYEGNVKIADLGIAKGRHRSQHTRLGEVKGKYAYMSPEQARGGPVDRRTDIFSVGVIFFELLTGMRLFHADDDLQVLEKVKSVTFPSGWERHVTPELRVLLRRALRMEVGQRYQEAMDFWKDLHRVVMEKSLLIHSSDFASYLRDHMENRSPSIRVERQCTRKITSTSQGSLSARFFLLILMIIGMLFVGSGHDLLLATAVEKPEFIDNEPDNGPIVKEPVKEPDKESLPKEPKKNTETESVPVIKLSKPSNVPAAPIPSPMITIHARPWALVTIPGLFSRKESPIRQKSLAPGHYEILLEYPPLNKVLKKRVAATAGEQITCTANFSGRESIHCRKK